MEKKNSISIWLVGIPKIYVTSVAIVGNFCSFVHHHVKTHEQISASTRYQQNETSFLHTMSL
jgi:hypothetical protein